MAKLTRAIGILGPNPHPFQSLPSCGGGRDSCSSQSVPRAGHVQSPVGDGTRRGSVAGYAGGRAGGRGHGVPAVVRSVRLDAAALGTFVHHLPRLQL